MRVWGGLVLLFLGAGPAWADKMVPMPIPALRSVPVASPQTKPTVAVPEPWPEQLVFVQELAAASNWQQISARMLTPQGDANDRLPIVADRLGLDRTTQDLLRALLVMVNDKTITRNRLNNVFSLYNEVLVRLGLTSPSQLAMFPKLQAVGQYLQLLREVNAGLS
ncbi:MAG TPA: hypothetical protein DCQ32_01380 [Cyanobacteria bacterium UBA8156]|jgi:hypothetical protein|nr:hypothetical protein [Cyanobacteria bacterium UBA8156]